MNILMSYQGNDEVYDPINFDAFFATEYGGFGGGSDQENKHAKRGTEQRQTVQIGTK